MSSDDRPFSPEREQTDESLRLEREKSDYTVGEHLAALEEKADAVISRARERADQVLAAARARADRQPLESSDGARSIVSERALEDRALEQERATADEALRVERAASVAVLSIEREETDKDLSSERALSDDSLATRDDFLGVVSHDLRNMLQVIAGYAKLIGEELELDHHEDRVRLHAQRIQRSGARMNRLIGDLIDVASIEAGSLRVARELADPAQIVTDAVDSLHTHAAARGVSLVFADMPQGLSAEIDPARIFQVLINLLSNAIKFTPARGDIVVRLERSEHELRFSVSDTGVGIPADKLGLVFERFLQVEANDRRGVGLGLYISRCIVQAHGGRIWAESRFGRGSTFYFTLPLQARTVAASDAASGRDRLDLRRR